MSLFDDKQPNSGLTAAGGEAFDQKIRRLDRLANLGLISASVAHEIKNGLVPINTFIELLLEKGEDPELTETVRRELRRIDLLVTQMLRFGAPGRNGGQETGKSVSVHEIFENTLRLLHYPISGKLIRVERKFHAGNGAVQGDEAQLQQVFMNLLLNATEAMGNNGVLTLSTEGVNNSGEDNQQLLIDVKDTGVGISKENLQRLFEPFFTTKKNGTGLGLTICERIIHEHGGSISVCSEPGQGSTVSLLLPAARQVYSPSSL
jgi:signal transduction histidine kinase